MKLFFWQNIISPHQMDFIKEVSKLYNVVLVIDEVQDKYRNNDGWEIPDFSFVKMYVQPNAEVLNQLFQNKEDVHVFSGIGAYKYVNKGFKKAIKHNAKIGVFSEPINMEGYKGFLKLIKGNVQRLKYGNKINFIAATGNLGIKTYLKFGYNPNKIFQWGYFVNQTQYQNVIKQHNIVYVGQLTERKQILNFTKFFIENKGLGFKLLNIIGKGPQQKELEDLIRASKSENEIYLLGRLSSEKTLELISRSSLLVIPSVFDGWAVVVNEALLCGTPVIASSNVGANILLDGENRGEVFEYDNMNELKHVIEKWSRKRLNNNDSENIKNWAIKNISPHSAACYFKEILDFVYHNSKNRPIAPWLK